MLNQFEKDTIIPYPNCKILKENIVLLLCIFFAKIVLSHYYKKKMDDVLNANLICMNKLLSCLIKFSLSNHEATSKLVLLFTMM